MPDDLGSSLEWLQPTVEVDAGPEVGQRRVTGTRNGRRAVAASAVIVALLLVAGSVFAAGRDHGDEGRKITTGGQPAGRELASSPPPDRTTTASPPPPDAELATGPDSSLAPPASAEVNPSSIPRDPTTQSSEADPASTSPATTAGGPATTDAGPSTTADSIVIVWPTPAPTLPGTGNPKFDVVVTPAASSVTVGDHVDVTIAVTNTGNAPGQYDTCHATPLRLEASNIPYAIFSYFFFDLWDGDPATFQQNVENGNDYRGIDLLEDPKSLACGDWPTWITMEPGQTLVHHDVWDVHLPPGERPTTQRCLTATFNYSKPWSHYLGDEAHGSTCVTVSDDDRRSLPLGPVYAALLADPRVATWAAPPEQSAIWFWFADGQWELTLRRSHTAPDGSTTLVARVDPVTNTVTDVKTHAGW